MNKIAMRMAVLAASLAVSGAAFAGSETATTGNGRPMVAPVADAKVAPTAGKDAPGQPKSAQAAQAADAKGTGHKAGQETNKQKPDNTAKPDAKTGTPAQAVVPENNAKK
ncbi:MAG: hypothetical protein H7837_13945 [Magnetococcus sp. MYC-9]